MQPSLLLGEHRRTLDERYRVSIPAAFADPLQADSQQADSQQADSQQADSQQADSQQAEAGDCILAKERPGALSLWSGREWQSRLDTGVALVENKMRAGRLEGRVEDVQRLGRLLSTRHKTVQLAGRGRLLISEGFREFLAVEPGGEVMVIGAGVCVEIWQPAAWFDYLKQQMPEFRQLFDQLSQ